MTESFQKIIEFLNTHQIEYELLEHQPVYTSEQAANIRGFSLSQGAKALLLKIPDGFILAVLPGDKKLDSKKVKALLAVKELRFATPEEVREVMGCEVGACFPLGNLIGIKMLVDQKLSQNKIIAFNPGVHNKSIKMRWTDYFQALNPTLVTITGD